jgi:hypothetical protein
VSLTKPFCETPEHNLHLQASVFGWVLYKLVTYRIAQIGSALFTDIKNKEEKEFPV